MRDDAGTVVGSIEPDPDGDRPVFRIVRRGVRDAGPNVRPCDHPEFRLDEKWSTVTCGKCGERVDPFAALMAYAEWWERMERHRYLMERAERRLLTESLRRLARLRDTTDEERAEIDTAIPRSRSGADLDELRSLERRISRAVQERKYERRRDRRAGGR